MAWFFALSCQVPALAPCVLEVLRQSRPLSPSIATLGNGLGHYLDGDPLLERHPTSTVPFDLFDGEPPASEVLIAHAHGRGFPLKDENTQPFRFRRIFFAHAGHVTDSARVRERILEALPEPIRGMRRGDTDSELLALATLRRLKERGGLEAPRAAAMGLALGDAIVDIERTLREEGVVRQPELSAVYSNGQHLVAARVGHPVSYRLIEGVFPCARCGLHDKTPEIHPSLRPHRRLRAVAVIAEPATPGWAELPERGLLTLSDELELKITQIAP
jgi:glutamine amidotransferase